MERTLGHATCSKGHIHPPWNTTGILRIAKCESVCGFCQKETKTAANLRKHVAIHIKNEALSLTIAEGSSGRGRLEITHSLDSPLSHNFQLSSDDSESSVSRSNASPPCRRTTLPSTPESFSPSAVLMSMHAPQPQHQHQHQHPGMQSRASYPSGTPSAALMLPHSQPNTPLPLPSPFSYPPPYTTHSNSSTPVPVPSNNGSYGGAMPHINTQTLYPLHHNDAFRPLRERKIPTKSAWTVIPATEGYAIMEFCKAQSVAQAAEPCTSTGTNTTSVFGMDVGTGSAGGAGSGGRTPCYNRETLFDEEWMAHMRDVHGLVCVWPETWIRRIEVLDLDAFGGDIGGIGELVEGT